MQHAPLSYKTHSLCETYEGMLKSLSLYMCVPYLLPLMFSLCPNLSMSEDIR